jgi:glyoxylase-like metal-dependent hydrolase (beta-lactamase superfamily II)
MGRAVSVTDLGGGVHRVTHPLPWALDHVHCYAIADRDGWTLVDAGLDSPETTAGWRRALAELGSPPVRRLVITHFHPDHIGASAALAELTGAAEILEGRIDEGIARNAWGDRQDLGAFERYLRLHGMPADVAAGSKLEEGGIGVRLAAPTGLLDEGDALDLGDETFRVLVLPGHADGHIALMGERTGRMFGGDVILDEITPNVGRWEDTLPDPLGRYLRSLERLADLRPAVVYPGHRRLIEDTPRRAAEIRLHHEGRLAQIEAVLRAGARSAWEVAIGVWGEGLGSHERRFALVESVSHLERLEAEGRAEQVEPERWAVAGGSTRRRGADGTRGTGRASPR